MEKLILRNLSLHSHALLKLDFHFNFSGVAEVLSLHWSLDRCGGKELKEGDLIGFESNQM